MTRLFDQDLPAIIGLGVISLFFVLMLLIFWGLYQLLTRKVRRKNQEKYEFASPVATRCNGLS
jgi:hypothetical protein